MGWDSGELLEVHGPLYDIVLFKHENTMGGISSFPWEGLGYEKILYSDNEPSPFEMLETTPHKRENFTPPPLISIVAKSIANNFQNFKEKPLFKVLPSVCLSYVFSHMLTEDLLRLSFDTTHLCLALNEFRKEASATIYYEKVKGCRKLSDYKNLSKRFPNLCLHLHMSDLKYHNLLQSGTDHICTHLNKHTIKKTKSEAAKYRSFSFDVCSADFLLGIPDDIRRDMSLGVKESEPVETTIVLGKEANDVMPLQFSDYPRVHDEANSLSPGACSP